MSNLTESVRNALLDLVFGNVAYTPPSTFYLGISMTEPNPDGSGFVEPGGCSGYERVAIPNDTAHFPSAGAGGKTLSAPAVFPESSSAWGVFVYAALFDASLNGNCILTAALETPILVEREGRAPEVTLTIADDTAAPTAPEDLAGTIAATSSLSATLTVTGEPDPGDPETPDWWVAPNGSATGAGTENSPWTLRVALESGGFPANSIKPGHLIYLKSGQYTQTANWFCTLIGTSTNTITFRNAPGAQATILKQSSGGISLYMDGEYVRFYGNFHYAEYNGSSQNGYLRFTCDQSNNTNRTINKVSGVNIRGRGNRVINCIVDNQGHPGIANQRNAINQGSSSIVEGNILFGNGYHHDTSMSNSAGNNCYSQNEAGQPRKYVRRNVSFASFTGALKSYASSEDLNVNMTFEGNIAFNNFQDRLFNAGSTQSFNTRGLQVTKNSFWNPDSHDNMTIELGDAPASGKGIINTDLTFSDNWIRGNTLTAGNYRWGSPFRLWNWRNVTAENNRFVGHRNICLCRPSSPNWSWENNDWYIRSAVSAPFIYFNSDADSAIEESNNFTQWQADGFDAAGSYTASAPTGQWARLHPCLTDPDIAFLVVYNWSGASSIDVDLGSAALSIDGSAWAQNGWQIRYWDVQNFFNATKSSFTYSTGVDRTFSLNLSGYITIVGSTAKTKARTPSEFNVFILDHYA